MPGFELIGDEEFAEVKHLFDKSKILFRHSFDNLRNDIYKVKEFENKFSKRMESPHALAVTSGTAALRVALAALNIKRGDEVITQSFTFVATAEAIIESGATPIITEIDQTLNMDYFDLEQKITKKTKAIIVVHMLGVPARLKKIKAIANNHNIPLIEDTAWGCGGSYEDIPLGSYGDIGTFSFDFAKTMTTGEGGMVTFKDKFVYEKAAAWHDHGHENNPLLPRWEDSRSSSGFNFRMNELQGAVGLAQLQKLDYVVSMQRENCNTIKESIKDFPIKNRVVPKNSIDTADALVFFVESNKIALSCRNQLLKEKIGTKILPEAITWHFAGCWNHMNELVDSLERPIEKSFTKSQSILSKCVAIPIMVKMEKSIPSKINEALSRVFK